MLKFGSPRLFRSRFSIVFALMRLQASRPASFGCLPRRISSTIEERAEAEQVGFAAAGGARGADVAVDVEAGAEDRRIAEPARNLPGQAARRRDAADVALGVDAVAVDRAVDVVLVDEPRRDHVEHHLRAPPPRVPAGSLM